MDPVAAAVGSCSGLSVTEFATGLEGWTIDNAWGNGADGLWTHNNEVSRDSGSLHYGRGTGGNYQTGNTRNSGRVYSPEYEIPSTGPNTLKFSVWRQVESESPGSDRLRLRTIGPSNGVLYSESSVGNTNGFESQTITLSNSLRGRTVRFQFEFDTMDGLYNNYEGIYIGRFEITACPPAGGGSSGLSPADETPVSSGLVDASPPLRRRTNGAGS
jgi:hypothetical protein